MNNPKFRSRLLFAQTSHSADFWFATSFSVPDPVFWLSHGKTTYLFLNALEADRGNKEARVDKVISLEQLEKECQMARGKKGRPEVRECLLFFLRKLKIRRLEVPASFPLGLADYFREEGIRLQVADPFFPQREYKSSEEIKHVRRGQAQAEAGLERGLEILRSATVASRNLLKWGGSTLTSERLRHEIDHAVRLAGGDPRETIAACGNQACDPHEKGHGPLRSNQTIILDIFPSDKRTGYHGDLTRTVVKGKARPAQKEMYEVVLDAQKWAISQIQNGLDGKKLQDEIREHFKNSGYPTEQRKGRWVGFFHGLGHGLGLEVHEAPRIAAGQLKTGQVVTVEPGLYYPGIGGVRIEDVVWIQPEGCRNLTRAPHLLEIP